MSAVDKTKLDGLESGATGDQTAAEILTATKTVDGTGSGLDADLLDGLSSAAFIQTESDPTVPASIKDGISWSEVTGKPTIPDGNSLDASDGTPTDALVVDAAGNVGVGTATPTEKLDVSGKINGTELCIASDCKSAWPSGGGDGHSLDAADGAPTDVVTVDNEGNIGMGVPGGSEVRLSLDQTVTSPSADAGAINATAKIEGAGNGTGIAGLFTASGDSSSAIPELSGVYALAQSDSDVNTGVGIEAGAIQTGGTMSLGIGANLSVFSMGGDITEAKGVNLNIASVGGTLTDVYGVYVDTQAGIGEITNAYGLYIDDFQGTNKYSIYAKDSGAPSYFAGNVGIGTTSPSLYKLEVEGSGNNTTSGSISVRNTSGGIGSGGVFTAFSSDSSGFVGAFPSTYTNTAIYADRFVVAANSTATGVSISAPTATQDIRFYSGGGGAIHERMRISSSGNVGIGTTSPSGKLDIEGGDVFIGTGTLTNASGSEDLSVTGNLEVDGSAYATAYYYTSDRRKKTDFEEINGLEKILKMRGVRFKWIKDGRPDVGLIAQEVEKVFPDLVFTNPKTGFKSVQYGNLVAPLIEATKEMMDMIEANAADIKKLKEENQEIKSELDELKDAVESIKAALKK